MHRARAVLMPQVEDAAFIEPGSIVRRVWGDPDLVLLIFAGGAAEFALNRAVDWLFFTNRLPNDPIGRLFSTVHYSQRIVFASRQDAIETLATIRRIHNAVEHSRGASIPDWAHRDVLYMLIDYTQRAYELMNGPLNAQERADLYEGFLRVGKGLHIPDLPQTYEQWRADRQLHLERDLIRSNHTDRLFQQYRRQLGPWRYQLLLELQALLVPEHVRALLKLKPTRWLFEPLIQVYSAIARIGLQQPVQRALIPRRYWSQIASLAPH